MNLNTATAEELRAFLNTIGIVNTDGEIVANLKIADLSGLTAEDNVLGRVDKRLIIGDNNKEGGSGLTGFFSNSSIEVRATGTPSQNGDDLISAYAAAQLLTPGGSALSATNRASLIIHPGVYELSAEWAISADYLDVYGVGAYGHQQSVHLTTNTVNVTADDVWVHGLDVGAQAFKLASNRPDHVITSCKGTGITSFGSDTSNDILAGTYRFCTGGTGSFGAGKPSGTLSGIFEDCIGDASSFTQYTGTLSGRFERCSAGISSFGNNDLDGGILTGLLLHCRVTSGDFSFITLGSGGKIRMCLDSSNNEVNLG